MQRNELLTQLETFLTANQQVADSAAPALKLLRASYAELRRPFSGDDNMAQHISAELASADHTISSLNDRAADREDFIYELLADIGMVPEVNDEPVANLSLAIDRVPTILESLREFVASKASGDTDTNTPRFIFAIRTLLGVGDAPLEDVYATLEGKAQYLSNLESGIAQRDGMIADLEAQLQDGRMVAPLAGWIQDSIDLAHAVRGDLSPENRVLAKAAEALIMMAPREEA